MKQQIGDKFEIMRQALQREEQEAMDWVEQDHREASGRLHRVLRDWTHHLNQVQKNTVCAKRALEQAGKEGPQVSWEGLAQHLKFIFTDPGSVLEGYVCMNTGGITQNCSAQSLAAE